MKQVGYLYVMLLWLLVSCEGPKVPQRVSDEAGKKEARFRESLAKQLSETFEQLPDSGKAIIEGWTIDSLDLIRQFYLNRQFAPAWSAYRQPDTNGRFLQGMMESAAAYGLDTLDYPSKNINSLLRQVKTATKKKVLPKLQSGIELLMTAGYLKMAEHLHRGRAFPNSSSRNYPLKRSNPDYLRLLQKALRNNTFPPTPRFAAALSFPLPSPAKRTGPDGTARPARFDPSPDPQPQNRFLGLLYCSP